MESYYTYYMKICFPSQMPTYATYSTWHRIFEWQVAERFHPNIYVYSLEIYYGNKKLHHIDIYCAGCAKCPIYKDGCGKQLCIAEVLEFPSYKWGRL